MTEINDMNAAAIDTCISLTYGAAGNPLLLVLLQHVNLYLEGIYGYDTAVVNGSTRVRACI